MKRNKYLIKLGVIFISSSFCLLSSCSFQKKNLYKNSIENQYSEILRDSNYNKYNNTPLVLPKSIKNELDINDNSHLLVNRPFSKIKISISVHNMPIEKFFTQISDLTKLSFVVSPLASTRLVSLSVSNISLLDLLKIIEKNYLVSCIEKNGFFSVDIIRRIRKVYYFRYPLLNRSIGSVAGSTTAATASSRAPTQSRQTIFEGLLTIFRRYLQSSDKEIGNTMSFLNNQFRKSVKSAKSNYKFIDSTIVFEAKTGIVEMNVYPSEYNYIKKILDHVESGLYKQVLIQAKLVEVVLNKTHQNGVNWDTIYSKFSGATGLTGLNADGTDPYSSSHDLTFSTSGIALFIRALSSQGHVYSLSSPRIVTLNNVPATIMVGTNQQYVEGVQAATDSNLSNTTTTSSAKTENAFDGISLYVSPSISDNNEITLSVHPNITKVDPVPLKLPTGNGQETTILSPKKITRDTDDMVLLHSGQSIVLGGLSMLNSNKLVSKISGHGLLAKLSEGGETGVSKSEYFVILQATLLNNKITKNLLINHAGKLLNMIN